MTDYAEERRRVAEGLRALRSDAALSTTELAKRLGWSQSKVSKTELGRTMPQSSDVDAWARATSAAGDVRDQLLELAERVATEAIEWRRELAPGRRRKQEEIRRLEAAASVIRVFSPDVVVGLAQTERYAEAMFRLGRGVGPAEDLQQVVEARMARQTALEDQSKRFHLLMSETALRRRVVSRLEMREQLTRLMELLRQPHIDLAVIPFSADERVHQYHGFAVLGDPALDEASIVLAETVTRGLTIRQPGEVLAYLDHFQALRLAAVAGDELQTFLHELAARDVDD